MNKERRNESLLRMIFMLKDHPVNESNVKEEYERLVERCGSPENALNYLKQRERNKQHSSFMRNS